MPNVMMNVTGRAVGASGENRAFAEMVCVAIAGVADHVRPTILVGADDNVRIDEDGHEVHPPSGRRDKAHDEDDADPAPDRDS